MVSTPAPTGLWWERPGVPAGPPAPPPPRLRGALTAVAAVAGAAMLSGTVYAIQSSERGSGGAIRTVAPKLAAIAAGCTGVREWNVDPAQTGVVDPGAGGRSTQVSYRTNPPSFGRYLAKTVPPSPAVYLPNAPYPIPERLVHNERRGYVVVFYDKIAAGNLPALNELAAAAPAMEKLLVVPWPSTRPPFPDGAHVGIATWGVTQTCQSVSTDAVRQFRRDYPPAVAPEHRLP